MNKYLLGLIAAPLLLTACQSDESDASETGSDLPEDWEGITAEAEGAEIGIYMWGGDDGVNQYLDEVVAPHLKDNYEITLTRYPMDAPDFLSKLMTEKEAGLEEGTADLLWINGENFRTAKNNGLLYGEFGSLLPNMEEYVGDEAPFVHMDMGTEIEGYQVPWGNVQFAFQYNSELVDTPPSSVSDLIQWSIDNPGKFTYPNVTDFTGNGFVRHIMYHVADDPADLETFNEEWLAENEEEIWDTLNSFKESLWRNGQTYPESLSQLDQLFANGETAFTMGFNEHRAGSLINDGIFPESTETVILDPGSISNTHYLSIPFNSQYPEAAMVAVNYMISADAQIKKADPGMWGEGTVLDFNLLQPEQIDELEEITGPALVESEDILPELDSRYHDWILENWEQKVVRQ